MFDRQFGRSDSQEPDPEGRVPDWSTASVQEMKDKFTAIGFGPRQVNLQSSTNVWICMKFIYFFGLAIFLLI